MSRKVSVAVAALFAIGLAASAGLSPLRADDDPTFRIEMKDGEITPSSIEVPARKRFRLEIANTGQTPAEFESKELKREKVVAPGTTGVVVFRSLEPGAYDYFDDFHHSSKLPQIVAK